MQLVFACLTGNGDAHAKNFAVLQDGTGEWRPSPTYDLPSSAPYDDLTMAMPVGDRVSGDYGRVDFLALAASMGLPRRAAERATTDIVERADLWLPDLDQLPFAGPRIHKLRKLIAYRRRRLS